MEQLIEAIWATPILYQNNKK